jgi:hypothetical protein
MRRLLLWLPALALVVITGISGILCFYKDKINASAYVDKEFRSLAQARNKESDPFNSNRKHSLEELISEIEREVGERRDEKERVSMIVQAVDSWFVHGLPQYRPCHNWSLYLLSQIPPVRERYPMGLLDPSEIVKSDYAFCNQSAIVLQAVLGHFGYEYASVRFNGGRFGGHFASAVKIGASWYFLDANIPDLYGGELIELRHIVGETPLTERIVRKRYRGHDKIPELIFESNSTGKTTISDINRYPAQRGLMLQRITKLFSDFAWLVAIIVTVSLSRYLSVGAPRRGTISE